MSFAETLNHLMDTYGLTSAALSEASGLSPAVISRYRNGERTPAAGGSQWDQLLQGLMNLLQPDSAMTLEALTSLFQESLPPGATGKVNLVNLNLLFDTLSLNASEVARALHFDASYLSRIRSGQRSIAQPAVFADGLCTFILRKYDTEADRQILTELLESSQEDLPAKESSTPETIKKSLITWLLGESAPEPSYITSFLNKIDEFNLADYLQAVHFDDLKVPSVPFYLPKSKTYYGIDGLKEAHVDFLKATVLSKSDAPLLICSDFPMEKMALDMDFNKKWMLGLALSLKKGLTIHIVHDLNRPQKEMFLGLESWIPLYMTGQIRPYYFRTPPTGVYHHLTFVSGAAALSAECIDSFPEDARAHVAVSRDDLTYYHKKSAHLLAKARPLMKIYTAADQESFRTFLSQLPSTPGHFRSIAPSLPLYTASESLLSRILVRCFPSASLREKILSYAAAQQQLMEQALSTSTWIQEVPLLSEEDYGTRPMHLPLTGLFLDDPVTLTYEEYLQHKEETAAFAAAHSSFHVVFQPKQTFSNIQILVSEGNWALISKSKAPSIHFLIQHPKLVQAIQDFHPPVQEAP